MIKKLKVRKLQEKIAYLLLRIPAIIIVFILAFILYNIISNGISIISWEFLTDIPRKRMTEGGIYPMIVGTIYLGIGAILIALPLGILSAIYLAEYAKKSWLIRIIDLAIINLAGVPSIVFGLFGYAFFVLYLDFGASIIAGCLTLAFMILPTIIKASEEALVSVPNSFREGALALGATKWQTIRHNVLPYAIPGIATGNILAVSRACGETAPILFTVAAYFLPSLPQSIFDQTMALSYHLYIMATQSINPKNTLPIQYGTALVLLLVVLGINLIAIIIRSYYRKKYRW